MKTPEFHVRQRWVQKAIVAREERITQHRVIHADLAQPQIGKSLEFHVDRPAA
jgi:hypothetical protein